MHQYRSWNCSKWETVNPHTKRMPAIFSRMKKITQKLITIVTPIREASQISDLCETIIISSEELRKNTDPKAKPTKKRSLIMLLQRLKSMGLSANEDKINPQQSSPLYLMALDAIDLHPTTETGPVTTSILKCWHSSLMNIFTRTWLFL